MVTDGKGFFDSHFVGKLAHKAEEVRVVVALSACRWERLPDVVRLFEGIP